jgi:hypothetical protein
MGYKKIKVSSYKTIIPIKDLIWNKFVDEVQKEYLINNTIDCSQESIENFERFISYKMRKYGISDNNLINGYMKDIFVVYNLFGIKYCVFLESYFVTNHKFPYNISNVIPIVLDMKK